MGKGENTVSVLFVNACNYGSTGKIVNDLCSLLASQNEKCLFAVPKTEMNKKNLKEKQILFGAKASRNLSAILCRTFGNSENFNIFNTYCLIKIIKKYKPDIIHLHNLHGNYLNLSFFFDFVRKEKISIVWTLHDCWSFTGRCPHFTISGCEKWKIGCYKCPYPKADYPVSRIDRTKYSWKKKKKAVTSLSNVTIITPSFWLAGLAKESFLNMHHIEVIHNGIDLSVFKPTTSLFRNKENIPEDKFILLGVAFDWGFRKGLDVFIELSKRLSNRYQIVLVGTNDSIDKELPSNIISIHRTNNQVELAEIYSSADLFINPTREENYPTVNMESLACGTPVLTFMTGGSPEIIDETCGSVVDCNDIDSLEKETIRICETKPYSQDACVKRAKTFDKNGRFQEYTNLYERMKQ